MNVDLSRHTEKLKKVRKRGSQLRSIRTLTKTLGRYYVADRVASYASSDYISPRLGNTQLY